MTGSTAPPDPPPTGPAAYPPPGGREDFFERLRALQVVRPRHGRMAGGVCAGLAQRLGVAPIVVRGGMVLLLTLGGFGLVAYLLALALLPDEDGKILLEGAIRRGQGDGIVLLVVIGMLVLGELADRWWVWLGVPLAIATWWFVRGAGSGKTPAQLGQEARGFGERLAGSARGMRRPDPVGMPPAVPGSVPAPSQGPQDAPVGSPVYAPGYPRPASAPPPAGGWPPVPPVGPAAVGQVSRGSYPVVGHGLGPGRTFTPTQTVPSPPAPCRQPAGFAFFLTVVGLGVALVGALMNSGVLTERTERPLGFALAAAAGLAGLALLGAGLRGLRAGGTAFVATVTLVAAVALSYGPTTLPLDGGVGERLWTPQAGQADPAYQLGAGEGTLDLSALPTAGAGQPVSASVGLGSLRIKVPAGMTARIEARLGAGDISVSGADGQRRSKTSGVGTGSTDSFLVGDPARAPDVVVRASVGLGEVVVQTDAPVTGKDGRSTGRISAPASSAPGTPTSTPTGGSR